MKRTSCHAGRPGMVAMLGTSFMLVAFIAAAASRAHAQTVQIPPPGRIDAIFARYDSDTAPGCAVSVLHADSVIFRKAYGMAHIGFGVPMTSATTSWIPYSEARTFVATAVAMLARDGALSLDDPVRRHVPEMPTYAADVTVRHLLHHTSGLADYGVLDVAFDLTDRISDDQMFRALDRWGKLGFPPGRGHMYSNTDYALLRILVERVSGESLHDYLHSNVLDRLGMQNTWLGADQARVPGAHSLFHDAQWRPVLRYRISPVGGISVTTNVDDLTKWALALRDSTSGLQSLLASLERGAPDSSDSYGLAYGIGRRVDAAMDLEEYRGVEGYRYLTRVPSRDLSVVLMCNHYDGVVTAGPNIARLFAGLADSTDQPSSSPVAPPAGRATVSVPVSELQRYVGEYRTVDDRVVGVRVELENGALYIVLPPERRLSTRPLGQGLFEADIPGFGLTHTQFTISGDDVLIAELDVETGKQVGEQLRRYVAIQLSPAELQGYVGAYEGDAVEATLHVTVDSGRLMLASRGLAPIKLNPNAERDEFRVDVYVARFQRDADGRVTHLTLDANRVKGMRYTRRAIR